MTLTRTQRLTTLRGELNMIFSPDLAHPNYYNAEKPSSGHCAVVATLLHNTFGGEILTCSVNGVPHWYNKIDDVYTDLTGDQFDRPRLQESQTPLYDVPHRVRSRPMGADLEARYDLLRSRIAVLREDLDFSMHEAFTRLTMDRKPTSWGYLYLSQLVVSRKKQGAVEALIPLLHYLINPYTPLAYLHALQGLLDAGGEPYVGVYDFKERIVRESDRRLKSAKPCT